MHISNQPISRPSNVVNRKSKTGLNELRSSLQAVQQEAAQAAGSGKMTQE